MSRLDREHVLSNKLTTMMFVAVSIQFTGCAYTLPPSSQAEGSEVGGTGDIKYSYEPLGADKHFLTVTAAPGIMETESSIAQRIHIFANKFAATACPRSFKFVHDPNFDQDISKGFMKRTKSYVFVCED